MNTVTIRQRKDLDFLRKEKDNFYKCSTVKIRQPNLCLSKELEKIINRYSFNELQFVSKQTDNYTEYYFDRESIFDIAKRIEEELDIILKDSPIEICVAMDNDNNYVAIYYDPKTDNLKEKIAKAFEIEINEINLDERVVLLLRNGDKLSFTCNFCRF